ncbi:MAG TPA: hypothetical protein VL383_05360 [Gemmatimonadaceae bacterium]|jgi:hypothetical protein|nr:hypothetical protein [Gemmatimonadaceae bacterium]
MKIPGHINARWMATLVDDQLITAEAELHAVFHRRESAEKTRAGAQYMLLHGPSGLVNAWLRWLLVNNETRSRGLFVRHPA